MEPSPLPPPPPGLLAACAKRARSDAVCDGEDDGITLDDAMRLAPLPPPAPAPWASSPSPPSPRPCPFRRVIFFLFLFLPLSLSLQLCYRLSERRAREASGDAARWLVGWLELGMRARREGREVLETWGSDGVLPCAPGLAQEGSQRLVAWLRKPDRRVAHD